MKYNNPVIRGFHPDPSICRAGEDYYLVTSSFEYFPGVPIFHSKDLVDWKKIGHCLTRESQLNLRESKSSLGIFAPTIRYHNGKFYMITTNFTIRKNFFVTADNPEGPWSDPIWLDWPGIDPSLLFEDDTVYVTGTQDIFSSETPGIYQAGLDIETGKIITERKLIWEGTGNAFPEGPHLYKINDYYFLMIAEGGTDYGHMVTVARSRNPYGPFESAPHNPILTHRSSDSSIQATGHADLIQYNDGSWWTVFLAVRPVPIFGGKTHNLGRETFLAPIDWTANGWPAAPSKIELEMDARSLPVGKQSKWISKDDFDDSQLDVEWNFLRNPSEESWSLTDRPGYLTLYGSAVTLDDMDSPSFLGRRQEHYNCRIAAKLEFSPNREGEEAGVTILMNEKFHYEIGLGMKDGSKKVFVRRRIGSLWKVEAEQNYDEDSAILMVDADPENYTFKFQSLNEEPVVLGKGECSLLSSEVAGGHTGVYIGLYATGNGKSAVSPAYFDWFSYDPL